KTSFIPGINRMQLTMKGVSYWSYKLYEEELLDSIIGGVFVQRPVDQDVSNLYINIHSDYAYKIEEYINQIIITFHEVDLQKQQKSYYAILNAYDEYEKGAFGNEFEMSPTICTNKENILLLSKPYESYEKAKEFTKNNSALLDTVVPGKKFSIVELDNTGLPNFSEEAGLIEIANTPIGMRDDEALSFVPLIVNGRFLGYDNTYTTYTYAQPNVILGDQEGDVFRFEYLYQSDVEGVSKEKIMEQQFSSINSAQFSHDSKYVAFIEQNDVLRMLQILSLEDGRLYIPAEDSFGIDTASFAWADDKNVLYAINGEFQSKQLLSYDLTNPDDVQVKGIFEQEFSESILQMKGNKIYYADRDPESLTSQICVVDIETGNVDKIADGYSFLLSPDGSKLLINDVEMINSMESYRLRYIDIESGTETIIQIGQTISDVTWSTHGERVYYSVYRDAGWDNPYPNALYYYDLNKKQSVYMMDIVSSALYASQNDDEVLMMCIFTYQKQPIPITYIVK
ncbi:MAG: hypothetical protein KAQ68_06680, partial [Clostridiales bacterium]|nr:hypothetical protein [Clostridiales bacterium]